MLPSDHFIRVYPWLQSPLFYQGRNNIPNPFKKQAKNDQMSVWGPFAMLRVTFSSFGVKTSFVHGIQEVPVGLVLFEFFEQEFHALHRGERVQDLPEHPHAVEVVLVHEELFLAGAGGVDVDGREHALVHELAVEVELHVAGALEFLEDHVIHAAARVHEGRGEDREAPPILDAARGAEEPFRPLEGVRVQAAGEHLAAGGNDGVMRAGQAGDAVQQDHHVLLVLHEALGALDHHVGHLHVPPGRGHDHAALAHADGRDEVHGPGGVVRGRVLQLDLFFRIIRSKVVEEDLGAGNLGVFVVDVVDLEQGEVPFAFLRGPDLAGDRVAGADVEPPDLRRRDVNVVRAGQVVVVRRPEEAEAVGQDLEHAFAEDHAVLFGLRLEDREDQLLLSHAAGALDLQLVGHIGQFGDVFPLQFYEVHGYSWVRPVVLSGRG